MVITGEINHARNRTFVPWDKNVFFFVYFKCLGLTVKLLS